MGELRTFIQCPTCGDATPGAVVVKCQECNTVFCNFDITDPGDWDSRRCPFCKSTSIVEHGKIRE